MHRMWKTIEKSYEHEVAVDVKTHLFLIKKSNKQPSSIAWDRRQLNVKLEKHERSM